MAQSLDTPELMSQRKNDHINICRDRDVESRSETFDAVLLAPEALPDFALAQVDTTVAFLGQTFAMPMLITGMTGGVERGRFINRRLAKSAAAWGIPMGLGSLKMMLASPERKPLFDVKRECPDVFLIGNLGINSFNYGVSVDDVCRLVDELGLDAMAFHVNALQEAIQPEGETNFNGALGRLEAVCKRVPCPVMVKEVGSGMSPETVVRLARAGVHAVDVGGASGTSWGFIEGCRGSSAEQRLGELFRNWGFSTVRSLVLGHQALEACFAHESFVPSTIIPASWAPPSHRKADPLATSPMPRESSSKALGRPQLVATGGIRNGLQVAKAVACGATMVGVGLPFLRAVLAEVQGDGGAPCEDRLDEEIEFFARGLRIAQFACGARTLADLPGRLHGISAT